MPPSPSHASVCPRMPRHAHARMPMRACPRMHADARAPGHARPRIPMYGRATPSTPATPAWQTLALVAWCLALGAYLLRLTRGQRVIPKLLREATHLTDDQLPMALAELGKLAGVRRQVAIVESPEFESPSLWTGALPKPLLQRGRRVPVIILPEGLASRLSPRELRWVLLHELAHLARRDHHTELVQRMLGAAFFFHPLVWLTNRIARGYREMACDDAALARCEVGDHKGCARALFEVVAHASALAQKPRARAHQTTHAMASLFHSKHLTRRRIMRLTEINRPLARGLRLSALVPIILVSSAALAAARFPAIAPQESFLDDVTDEEMDHNEAPRDTIRNAGYTAVAATDWLLTNQRKDGSWIYVNPTREVEPESNVADWAKGLDHLGYVASEKDKFEPYHSTVALTALGLQALSKRSAHEPENVGLKGAMNRAAAFLVSQQDPETGMFGEENWNTMVGQCLATEALAKAMKEDMTDELLECLTLSVSMLEKARNPYAAWRYDVVPVGENDARVTGYVMLALVAAYDVGAKAKPETFAAGMGYLMALENQESGRTFYMDDDEFAARIVSRRLSHPASLAEVPTAMHLRLRNAAGFEEVPHGGMAKAIQVLAGRPPEFNQKGGLIDYTYWWQATEALASSKERGEVWQDWKGDLLASLLGNRVLTEENHVTWPTVDAWSAPGMEAYTTATCALALYALIDGE